ncbi:MAG: thiamine pyrophosphate-binding protein [Candidatus Thorarchaeota archaeon]
MAETLKKLGVEYVFTLCGGHISPILVNCKKLGLNIIDTRHEVTTVFAADGMSRMSGKPGIAVVTAGPGLTNVITAIKNAQMAQSPLVLIGGATATILKGRGSLQDIDQMRLIKPLCKWSKTLKKVCDIPQMINKAFIKAQSDVPGPVFLEIPLDLLYPEKIVRKWYIYSNSTNKKSIKKKIEDYYLNFHLNRIFSGTPTTGSVSIIEPSKKIVSENKINKILTILKNSHHPLILLGSQVTLNVKNINTLVKSIEKIGIPLYTSGMSRGLLGKEHELLLRHRRRQALKEADIVILAGVPMDFRLDFGRKISRKTKIISVNRSNTDLKMNRRPEIGLQAEPDLFLISLASKVDNSFPKFSEWKKLLHKRENEREGEINQLEKEIGEFINPLHFCKVLNTFIGNNSILIADGGDFIGTASYIVQPRGPLAWLDPGVFGTLGVGAGFALAAKLFKKNAEVWILYGDGSVGYSLMEFDTFIRHKIPVIAVIGNDAGWSQVAREQINIYDDDVATKLGYISYQKVIEGFGAEGMLITNASQIESTLIQAKELAKKGKPVMINVQLSRSSFREGSISM